MPVQEKHSLNAYWIDKGSPWVPVTWGQWVKKSPGWWLSGAEAHEASWPTRWWMVTKVSQALHTQRNVRATQTLNLQSESFKRAWHTWHSRWKRLGWHEDCWRGHAGPVPVLSLHQEPRRHLRVASAVCFGVLLSQTLLIPLPLWTLQHHSYHSKLCASYIAEKVLLEFSFPKGFTRLL